MKKILVVDDTLENIEAAKEFFSSIPGFEFVYATNKEDAEVLLPDAYALITDGNFPYFEGDKEYSPDSGYLLGILAKMEGKPVIMITEHGGLRLSEVNNNCEDFEKVKEIAKRLSNLKGRNNGAELYYLCEGDFMELVHRRSNIYNFDFIHATKKDSLSWLIAWERLQNQFK